MRHVEVSLSAHLSANDWKQFKAFCEKVIRLAGTKMVAGNGTAISGKMRYHHQEGLSFECALPPEDTISEFLMAFRFFYLEKEPTHFPKILGIIGRHTSSNEDMCRALKVWGKQWHDSLFRKALNFKLNGEPITTKLLLDLWINAHYFHGDNETKIANLEKLKQGFSEQFAKYMFLEATFEATKVVIKVYHVIRDMVERHFAPGPTKGAP